MVVGWLQQQAWTVEDGSARSVVEVVAEELTEPAVGDRPTDTGHYERRRVASLSYVEMEDVRHNVEEGSEKPPKPRIRGEQELTRLG